MLEAIILFLNTRLRVLFPDFELKGLCELVKDDNKAFTAPAEYCSDGTYKHIDFDNSKGLIYYRKNGDVSISSIDESTTPTCDIYEAHTFPIKLVLYAPKNIYDTDNAHIDDKLANNVKKAIQTSNDKTLNQTLKSSLASILVTDYTTNRNDVISSEYAGEGVDVNVGFDKVLISLDLEVKIEGKLSCFEYYGCNDEVTDVRFCPVVINSNGEVLVNGLSGSGEVTIQDSKIYDTDGNELYSVPATTDQIIADTIVKNSANTTIGQGVAEGVITLVDKLLLSSDSVYSSPIIQGVNKTIPDITIVRYDGVSMSPQAYRETLTSTQLPRAYAYPIPTGITTIFRTGDDAYIQQNVFASQSRGYIIPSISFYLMAENESYGHAFRFIGLTGGYYDHTTAQYKTSAGVVTTKATAFPNDYVIDRRTGLGWYAVWTYKSTWNLAIDDGLTLSAAGFTGYFLPNRNQGLSIARQDGAGITATSGFAYPPFDCPTGTFTRFVFSTGISGVAQSVSTNNAGQFTDVVKANPIPVTTGLIYCRKHF